MTEEVKKRLYEKTTGRCILCGKKIANNLEGSSVEHFIPRAIYKWVPSRNLKIILESSENLFIVHYHCNIKKDSALPNLKQIVNLPVNETIKDQIFRLYNFVEVEIIAYRQIKQTVWESQQRQCATCHKPISILKATLRRKDNKRPRVADNAMCLCVRCNRQADSNKRKHRRGEIVAMNEST